MKKFIAYFDYLGFKQFIENNDLEYQKRIVNNNFRDMETALSQEKRTEGNRGVIADLSAHKINCINFSDTVVYWSNDDSDSSLAEILKVAYIFNWQTTLHFFPARGALAFGEIEYVDFVHKNSNGGIYNLNSLFGKGLVIAHEKAESQQWSGTVLDITFTEEIERRGFVLETLLKPYAKKHKIPYKNNPPQVEEYALRLIKPPLNQVAFQNLSGLIRDNFAKHNKETSSDDVQIKIDNTLNFLKSDLL